MEKKVLIWLPLLIVTAAVITFFLLHPVTAQVNITRSEPKKVQEAAKEEAKFTPLQVTLVPGEFTSLTDQQTPVYGMSVGGLVCQHEVNGVSLAAAHVHNAKKHGVSMSFFERSGEANGLTCFLVGTTKINRGCSLALLNMTEDNEGVQVGIVNRTGANFLSDDYTGSPRQPQNDFGVQTGLFNYSEGKGIQFGLLNANPKAVIKYMPLFNFAW